MNQLVAFVNIVVLNTIFWVLSMYLVGKYSENGSVNGDIATAMVGTLILQLLFLFIGSAIAAVSKKPKLAVSLSTGILLITYMLSIAIDLNEKLAFMKYLSRFKYFEAKIVMNGGGLDVVFVQWSIVIIAALSIITFVFYKK